MKIWNEKIKEITENKISSDELIFIINNPVVSKDIKLSHYTKEEQKEINIMLKQMAVTSLQLMEKITEMLDKHIDKILNLK